MGEFKAAILDKDQIAKILEKRKARQYSLIKLARDLDMLTRVTRTICEDVKQSLKDFDKVTAELEKIGVIDLSNPSEYSIDELEFLNMDGYHQINKS